MKTGESALRLLVLPANVGSPRLGKNFVPRLDFPRIVALLIDLSTLGEAHCGEVRHGHRRSRRRGRTRGGISPKGACAHGARQDAPETKPYWQAFGCRANRT